MEQEGNIPINTTDAPSVVLDLIYQLKIKDVMGRNVITAGKSDTLRHIQGLMRENYISGLPITEGQTLVGIISIEDIIRALDLGYIDRLADDYMTRNVIVLEEDMPLSFAITFLNKYRYGRFPVINKKKEMTGIITSKNVIHTLLTEMNKEVQRLETLQQKQARPQDNNSQMSFATVRYDFELAGRASTEIKKALKSRNIDPKIVRRIAIASYELEINQVVHSLGGTMNYSIQPDRVVIEAVDTGPGIADINLALQEGWSTADEWIRSLGFGAGMGLANTKRVSDEFTISSTVGVGTTVRSTVFFNSPKEE
ncbi:MAG: CBS domain-containing protein [Treponema sp.]|nr:CBS domain-containing protein [Treponema sp.]